MDSISNQTGHPRTNPNQVHNNNYGKTIPSFPSKRPGPNYNYVHGPNGRFQKVNPDKIIEEPSTLNPKISKRYKTSDYKKLKLIQLDRPIKLPEGSRRKYVIKARYVDPKDASQKVHEKNVQFGKSKDEDFVDTNFPGTKLKAVGRLGNVDNFLHENFYRQWLLNGPSTDIYSNLKHVCDVMLT